MKRIVLMAFVAASLCVPAAQAAAPKGPTMAQFNALKAQLAKDEKKIKALEVESNYTYGVMLCLNANNADTFQGTWQAVDALATSLGKPAMFGTQTTVVDDSDACNVLGKITRSHAIPTNVLLFSAVAKLITG
jgi:hypothetical protein